MSNNLTITIGMPTYNRREAVVQRVKDLLSCNLHNGVKILVVDNASPDGTFEELSQLVNFDNFRVLRNETNLGYAGNFLRLFECCETDYLVVVSDEDEVCTSNLAAYINFLEKESPDFVSPRALVGGEVYRGKAKTCLIDLVDFESAGFYLSGLTFKMRKCCEVIRYIKENRTKNSAVEVYPQVIIALFLIAHECRCYWWCGVISNECQQLESHIFDVGGIQYFHLQARWLQYIGYIDCFNYLIEQSSNEKINNVLKKALLNYEVTLYGKLRSGMAMERPKSVAILDFGAREMHVVGRTFKVISSLIMNPAKTTKKIFKKLKLFN